MNGYITFHPGEKICPAYVQTNFITMVTVVDYVKQKTEDGKEFIRLLLQGNDLTLITTDAGRVYAKVSKASIIAAISEEVAQQQVGKQLQGTIEKVDSEPWTYVIRETGEQRILNYRYQYNPTGTSLVPEEEVA